jgi:histone H3/H4
LKKKKRKNGRFIMPELSCASMERILRNANALRVSAGAVETMVETMEIYGYLIAREAVQLAKHAGRKTVKKEDVKLVVKKWGINP